VSKNNVEPKGERDPSENGAKATGGRMYGVLVTFRRPDDLTATLARLGEQDRPLDGLFVVDNAPSEETQEIVRRAAETATGSIEYLPMPENLGFPGGISSGMNRVLKFASDDDWIVVLDDDDPPNTADTFSELHRFAEEMVAADPRTACVGFGGGRYDTRKGRMVRVETAELDGPVPVDFIGGNLFGCYRVGAVRSAGPWLAEIFFEYDEVEHGLRLRRAGYTLYAHGTVWKLRRAEAGRLDHVMVPAWGLDAPGWRRYYHVRNQIFILRRYGTRAAAARRTFVLGFAKPLANLAVSPKRAIGHLRLSVKASRDAWAGRMGRRVEPFPWGPRPAVRADRAGTRTR